MTRRDLGIAGAVAAVVLALLAGLVWWWWRSDVEYAIEELDYNGETTAALVQRFGPGARARTLWEIEIDEELSHAICGSLDRPGRPGLLFTHRVSVPRHIVVEGDAPAPEDRSLLDQCRQARRDYPGQVVRLG